MNAKDTLQLKDNPFRLQMLWTPLLSPVQKEQIVYIFKKKKPTAARVLNGVISQGFARERQQAGVHFSELAESLCLCAG